MSLLASLTNSSNALSAFDRAITVTQNNVNNADTPGYATQRLDMSAQPFDPAEGLAGGVRAGDTQSSRNAYGEAAVDRAQTSLGLATQQSSSLTAVQNALNLSAANGIPATLGALFQSFSAWSQDPTSATNRQSVMTSAQQVVDSFRTTVTNLQQVEQDTETQIGQSVNQINAYAQQLASFNAQIRSGDRSDAALDAQIHNTLESLGQIVNFTAAMQEDGTVTVLVGGQTPLVVADHAFSITSQIADPASLPPGNPGVPPSASILDGAGRDVTAQITGGNLGALLETNNQVLASLLGDASQPGALNQLAQTFADRVNELLTAGYVSDGPPPAGGVPLFSYDTSNATNAAATLALTPGVTGDQLAAIDPGPPYASNGTALKLAALANPQDPADEISNSSYVEFFGNLAAGVGRQLAAANDEQTIQQQVLTQAQSLRQQLSGVSLDEQAARLVEYQRAYQANAQLFSVLNSLTATVVNMLQT
ncbi:MAG: flagellar hook-associated protein FlgK [Acidobacteriia bacterium]|nr:flagellar hook-associated protein FlgK [Terriglobia bacterium]